MSAPLDALRRNVTGRVEAGLAEPIVAVEAPLSVGDRIVTTVYRIGNRSDEVEGTITEVVMSKRYPERVAFYTTATETHGTLSVEAAKARKPSRPHYECNHRTTTCRDCDGTPMPSSPWV